MKAYTLGNNGFVRPEVIAAIGEAPHVRQASVLVVAKTKKQAARIAAQHHLWVSMSDPDFRVASGPHVDALRATGLLNDEAVYAMPMTRAESPVVRVRDGGEPEFLGSLRRTGGTVVFSRKEQPHV